MYTFVVDNIYFLRILLNAFSHGEVQKTIILKLIFRFDIFKHVPERYIKANNLFSNLLYTRIRHYITVQENEQ